MEYIKIPIKVRSIGVTLAEDYFGAMIWRRMANGDIVAYPYDNNFPIVITKESLRYSEPGKE